MYCADPQNKVRSTNLNQIFLQTELICAAVSTETSQTKAYVLGKIAHRRPKKSHLHSFECQLLKQALARDDQEQFTTLTEIWKTVTWGWWAVRTTAMTEDIGVMALVLFHVHFIFNLRLIINYFDLHLKWWLNSTTHLHKNTSQGSCCFIANSPSIPLLYHNSSLPAECNVLQRFKH